MRHTDSPNLMLLIWEVWLRIVDFNIFVPNIGPNYGPNNITLHNL